MYKGATNSLAKEIAYQQPNRGTVEEKRFDCPESGCKETFSSKDRLAAHMVTHTGEKPFPCPLASCGKAFKWRSSLKYHTDKHEKRNELEFIEGVGLVEPGSFPVSSPVGDSSGVTVGGSGEVPGGESGEGMGELPGGGPGKEPGGGSHGLSD